MKAARIVVLAVALGAGGIAAYLASGSKEAPPAPAPVGQTIDTVEILVAKGDINMGQVVAGNDIQWQAWPTSAASSHFVRRRDRPNAIEQLTGSIARPPLAPGRPRPTAPPAPSAGRGGPARPPRTPPPARPPPPLSPRGSRSARPS